MQARPTPRLIDLSHPITDGMPVYPGDPEVAISPALSVAADGVAVARLDIGSHTGTHMDAPAHSIIGGRTIDDVDPERLMGRARVLHLREAAEKATEIGADAIAGGVPDQLPQIVLIATGWDAHYGDASRMRHPYLAESLARDLWERGARVLGVDTLSPDATAAGAEEADAVDAPSTMPVHAFWLGSDGVIIENLTRLTELPESAEVVMLPLRIAGGDGSPIRAVAHVA